MSRRHSEALGCGSTVGGVRPEIDQRLDRAGDYCLIVITLFCDMDFELESFLDYIELTTYLIIIKIIIIRTYDGIFTMFITFF